MIIGCICCGVGELALGSAILGGVAVLIRRYKKWRCKCKCHDHPEHTDSKKT